MEHIVFLVFVGFFVVFAMSLRNYEEDITKYLQKNVIRKEFNDNDSRE